MQNTREGILHLIYFAIPTEKEERPLTEEIQTDVAALASFPPMDWKRTSKDYIKIVFIFFLVLIFALNVSLFRRFRGEDTN